MKKRFPAAGKRFFGGAAASQRPEKKIESVV
jgi:hypothetical protein